MKEPMVRDIGSTDSEFENEDSIESIPQTTWNSVKIFLYNPRNGTCCHRNSREWIAMIFYYLGYTAFIAILYLGFLYGTVTIIKNFHPDSAIIDKEGLLEGHPGLGFVPNIVVTKYPIIWYTTDPDEEYTKEDYVKAIDDFLQKYKDAKQSEYVDCSTEKKNKKPCYVDLNLLEECTSEGYHYTNSSLCFFLKLNRRQHWKPVFFKREQDLPDEMSQSMMDHILASSNKDVVYVECLGQNYWDNEHMGKMTYYPKQGFDGGYFPYEGESGYLAPLVAVKLDELTTGVVIHITCTVWAMNIEARLNHLHVKVFVDNTLPY